MGINEKLKKYTLLVFVFVFIGYVVHSLYKTGRSDGYAPEQPIPFSHKIHAGDNSIPCLYCHVGAEKSKHATVPPMNVCFNCHSVVKTDSPWIKKLRESYDKGESIQWVKVHDLPDFVNFSHKRHVAKGVTCETCHGDVKTMAKVRQEKPMTMGWCVECHKGQTTPAYIYESKAHQFGVPSTDGGLGHTKASVAMTQGVDPSTLPATSVKHGSPVAPVSCWTCHK